MQNNIKLSEQTSEIDILIKSVFKMRALVFFP